LLTFVYSQRAGGTETIDAAVCRHRIIGELNHDGHPERA